MFNQGHKIFLKARGEVYVILLPWSVSVRRKIRKRDWLRLKVVPCRTLQQIN